MTIFSEGYTHCIICKKKLRKTERKIANQTNEPLCKKDKKWLTEVIEKCAMKK